jgi:hypothetical protein
VLFDALAFIVLDAGTRSPQRLVADVRRAFAERRGLASGFARFTIGIAAIIAGAMAIAPFDAAHPFLFVIALFAGLAIEQLIGPDLRGRAAKG